MKIFDFSFKKNDDASMEKAIRRLIEYMPDQYTSNAFFNNSIKYVNQNEWALAIDNLINLALESNHYFSDEFWTMMADCAEKMKRNDLYQICKKQKIRNKEDLSFAPPFGWTTVKIDEQHLQHYIAEKIRDEWALERHQKDGVFDLLNDEGVHYKNYGRSGFLYIVINGHMAELEFEHNAVGLSLDYNALSHWSLPLKSQLSLEEKENIKQNILHWGASTGHAIALD